MKWNYERPQCVCCDCVAVCHSVFPTLCVLQESLKVEMALTEAKFESAQRSLEADLQAQMEKKVSGWGWGVGGDFVTCFMSACPSLRSLGRRLLAPKS